MIVYSYLTPIIMAVEILSAQLIFTPLLLKRENYLLRLIGGFFVALLLTFLCELIYVKITGEAFSYVGGNSQLSGDEKFFRSALKFAYYLIIFVLTTSCIYLSFDNGFLVILFYCAGGYATQHLAKSLSALIIKFIPIISANIWLSLLFEIVICVGVYIAVYYILVYGKTLPESPKNMVHKLLLTLTVVIICIGISRFTTDDTSRSLSAFIAENLYAILSCALVLTVISTITENDAIKNEVDIMTELLKREKEQYELSKENIDLINIKCHDLKHQIKALRSTDNEQYVKEIEDAIMIYDSVIKTGNDALDVILTEKSLICEKNNINLTCIVDGKSLAFMDNIDLYSLFGNALSNAIESVMDIKDIDRRCISINVHEIGNTLSVHIENYYDGVVTLKNGLPVTNKNQNYHGFGVKSMNYIAKKYGGFMTVSAEDGIFSLDFIFNR